MITELRIRGLGVIESAEIELGPGLNVITGETGTGKTMVLTALTLLLGGKGDASRVRAGATKTLVEGIWEPTPPLRQALEAVDGDVVDEGVMLARTVSAEGRSRAFLGGRTVPAATLASLAEDLVVVHGQSDQQRLARPGTQRRLLDAFAGASVDAVLADYQDTFARLRDAEENLLRLRASQRERAQRAEFLRFALEEIERVDPLPGEEHELARQEERLSHAELLREAATSALTQLSDTGLDQAIDAHSTVSRAVVELQRVGQHDPTLAELARRLIDVVTNLSDVAADLSSHLSELEADPARLDEVSTRRATVSGLLAKYGESTDAVLDWSRAAAAELVDLEDDERLGRLEAEVERLRHHLGARAGDLAQARAQAAAKLSEAITGELSGLAMPRAAVLVTSTPRRVPAGGSPPASTIVTTVGDEQWACGPHGGDQVAFSLRSYPGADALPIASSASGGELSRVMLAVEVTLAGDMPPPTLVFDEVDAGIGGAAAEAVGRRLAELARHTQVVVVTHLPQVAAYGGCQLRVDRAKDGTTATVTRLDREQRVAELARMLSGREGSESARQHAEELLADAQQRD